MDIFRKLKNGMLILLASGFGLGLIPVMPGTFGALLGVILHIGIVLYLPAFFHFPALVVAFLLVCWGNHVLTPWAVGYWGDHDPKYFILDEIAGYLFVPILFRSEVLWKTVICGFFLFRAFDIFKIGPPAKWIDTHMSGSWGILLDDIVSATYAATILLLLYHFGPKWIVS